MNENQAQNPKVANRPNKNIYISPKDQEVWEEAERLATSDGRSLSNLIARLLRDYVKANNQGGSPS